MSMPPTTPPVSRTEMISVFRSLSDIPSVSFPSRLDSMLLAVCKQGEISAVIDVAPRRMGPSSIMVLRPGHIISQCRQSDDFDGFFIVAQEEKINDILPSLHYVIPYSIHYNANPIIEITAEELETQTLIYAMLQRQIKSSDRLFNKMALSSMCEVLFYNTLGIYASRVNNTRHNSRREELLSQFIDLIEANFKTERAVNFYAEKLFVTPKHLSAVLKEISGKTAGEWIDHRVILEAKLLLRTTGMNIQEISVALNFSNQSFFGKYFKHLTGLSPREYRNRISES
ncbi:helix-turn-helix transcriptional regulator [Duncaniella dubosii]|uniref:AraC family transcriptional regulator n=4 Tax=Muribaculaceae TaxID=2005473 RepID=A0A4P7W7D0_9BACT|nr:helix-turn-helix transcriptional regulator [Duncaniella dubosii]MBJ2189296.1 AraC family transcriptional regulator [Muribaculaceae bacterium]QCD43335.1 AraC family transcriptional regulator [Duncaniella dubosii]HBN64410.1 AraC family transcriptional regulator [Porphyromonadaceae bacterium]